MQREVQQSPAERSEDCGETVGADRPLPAIGNYSVFDAAQRPQMGGEGGWLGKPAISTKNCNIPH
jgi:hypothetical protein